VNFRHDARRLLTLAWPVFIGQLAVLLFSTLDTLMLGRVGAEDLAALAVGAAAYVTIFVGFMGVVLAVAPIAGREFGARDQPAAGHSFVQAQWLALLLSLPGCLALWFPAPFIALAQLDAAQAAKVQSYTRPEAFALPFALLFTAFRGFAQSVSRPKAVMALQVVGLGLKLPLNALLIFGAGPVPAMGVAGAGCATAIALILQASIAQAVLRHDAFYAPFLIPHLWDTRPERAALTRLVRLGLPMGGSILVEVTGFTFMAFFIARLGPTAVAGHQIAVNLVSMMFMLALAIATAAGTLVAQHLGAREHARAAQVAWRSILLGAGIAATVGALVAWLREPIVALYTINRAAAEAALPLLVWLWFFHLADALQTIAAYVLRAYHVATLPMVAYVIALWGIGIGGGYWLAFGPHAAGSLGFWQAATAGLIAAAALLLGLTAYVFKAQARG
jgi:MATE family multidrug resistance protein